MRRVLRPLVLVVAILFALVWFMRDGDEEPTAREEHPVQAAASTVASSPAWGPAPSRSTAASGVSSPSPSGEVAPSPSETPASTVDAGEVEGEVVDPSAAAVPRDAAQEERFARYERAAIEFLTAFARPPAGLSSQQWWAGVSPLLSEVAVDAYAGTDPNSVPFTAVTGPAVIVPTDAPADLLMAARVATDAGFYLVEMATGPDGIRISRVTLEEAAR